MKIINVLRDGDFVKLKTLEQLSDENKQVSEDRCPVIGGLWVYENEMLNGFVIEPNVIEQLGNVLRLARVSSGSNNIYCQAEAKGVSFPYNEHSSNSIDFDDRIIDQALINGHWYKADMDLNCLYV